jgi:hypothetical protein
VSAQVIAGCTGLPSGGAEDMGVDLARDADGGDAGADPPRDLGEGGVEAGHPVGGVLLHEGAVARGRIARA